MNPPTEDIAGYAVGTQNLSACVADVLFALRRQRPGQRERGTGGGNPGSRGKAKGQE